MSIEGTAFTYDIVPIVFPIQEGVFVSNQNLNNPMIRNLCNKLKFFDDSFTDAYMSTLFVGAVCVVSGGSGPTFEVSLHTPLDKRTRFILLRFESPNSSLYKTSGSPTSSFRTTPHLIIAYTIDKNNEIVARIVVTLAEYLEYMSKWLSSVSHMGNTTFSAQKPEFDKMITARSYNEPMLFEDSELSKLMYACLSNIYSIMINDSNREYDQMANHIVIEDIPHILKLFPKNYESMLPLDVRAILKLVS